MKKNKLLIKRDKELDLYYIVLAYGVNVRKALTYILLILFIPGFNTKLLNQFNNVNLTGGREIDQFRDKIYFKNRTEAKGAVALIESYMIMN